MMNYFKQTLTGMKSLLSGIKVTLKYLFKPTKTLLYPYEQPKIPKGSRGLLIMNYDKKTKHTKCTACNICVLVCPVRAIEIESEKNPETNKKEMKKYVFDHQKCMYCGLCTEVCPFKAIDWSKDFEHASLNKEKKTYNQYLKE